MSDLNLLVHTANLRGVIASAIATVDLSETNEIIQPAITVITAESLGSGMCEEVTPDAVVSGEPSTWVCLKAEDESVRTANYLRPRNAEPPEIVILNSSNKIWVHGAAAIAMGETGERAVAGIADHAA